MFDSFSSPQPQVLHTLSVWWWSLSPVERGEGRRGGGEREKAEDSCCGLSGTQASAENSARDEGKHVIMQPVLGVRVHKCVRLPVCKCALEMTHWVVTESLRILEKQEMWSRASAKSGKTGWATNVFKYDCSYITKRIFHSPFFFFFFATPLFTSTTAQ